MGVQPGMHPDPSAQCHVEAPGGGGGKGEGGWGRLPGGVGEGGVGPVAGTAIFLGVRARSPDSEGSAC
eukprot:7015533-Pyramimonas_sp.AAC.2